ncbi:unnamed protein product, partial [Medioppia subpectinata]
SRSSNVGGHQIHVSNDLHRAVREILALCLLHEIHVLCESLRNDPSFVVPGNDGHDLLVLRQNLAQSHDLVDFDAGLPFREIPGILDVLQNWGQNVPDFHHFDFPYELMATKKVRKRKPRAIICDIEGTTTSVKYWGECLVPYIKFNTKICLKSRWDAPLLMDLINNLRISTAADNENGANIPAIADTDRSRDVIIETVSNNVIHQMNNRRYGKALQHLQLYVWYYGYQKNDFKGHVFEDVSRAFNQWHNFQNLKVYVYSSGVYLSQKLLFSCSVKGNLTPLIRDYFDVETYGSKTSGDKLNAAKGVGCDVLLAIRPFNRELTEEEKQGLDTIESFDDIAFT